MPTLLNLKERGYGEDKGVSTLVIAASSIDDIFSISAFGIFLSSLFSKEGIYFLKYFFETTLFSAQIIFNFPLKLLLIIYLQEI